MTKFLGVKIANNKLIIIYNYLISHTNQHFVFFVLHLTL